jgi:hypothetical protein
MQDHQVLFHIRHANPDVREIVDHAVQLGVNPTHEPGTRLSPPSLIGSLLVSKIARTPRIFEVFLARNGLCHRR